MSLFCSPMGVVAPALFPLVPGLESITGIPSTILFLAIIIGAQSTVISPFSSGGSLLLSMVTGDERNKLFNDLLVKGAPVYLLCAIIYVIILSIIL